MERRQAPTQPTSGADRLGRGAASDRLPIPGKSEAGVVAGGGSGVTDGAAAAALTDALGEDVEEASLLGGFKKNSCRCFRFSDNFMSAALSLCYVLVLVHFFLFFVVACCIYISPH